jgi:RNA polymerase sigma-70 factor, ECF subfamily
VCYKLPPTNFQATTVYLPVGAEGDAEDRTLVERCLGGDTEAFHPLVEKYHRPLYAVAVRMLGNREDARDATQNAFVKAYRGLGKYDPSYRFFSWVYRILVNECLNELRARRPMTALNESLVQPGTPMDEVQASESRRQVRRAVLQLPPEQREVIVLRHFGGLSYAQVGAALGLPETTVRSRLFGARQRLFELLAGRVTK